MMSRKLFGTDGIRGCANKEPMTAETVLQVGLAAGNYFTRGKHRHNVVIGKNCILNTKCIIEHDAVVDDHCHVSTGAILNGKVFLGRGSFVGSGSVVKEEVKIGNYCVISGNSFLKKYKAFP